MFFEEASFLEQSLLFSIYFFQISCFFSARPPLSSCFLKINSSLGQLVFQNSHFSGGQITFSTKLLLQKTYFLVQFFFRKVAFWKQLIFQKINILLQLLFQERCFIKATTLSKELLFQNIFF